jgi:hypothetical protein
LNSGLHNARRRLRSLCREKTSTRLPEWQALLATLSVSRILNAKAVWAGRLRAAPSKQVRIGPPDELVRRVTVAQLAEADAHRGAG